MQRILIVEDSAAFRKTFNAALCCHFPALIVENAADGEEALKKIETFRPSLIFMDVRLPSENGFDLTGKIKASYPDIKVIILTNYDLPEYREAARNEGADDFIPKGSLNLSKIEVLIKHLTGG